MQYEHTQIGYFTICVLFGAAIFVAVTGILTSARGGVLIQCNDRSDPAHFRDRA
jgi:hypothetical protein